MKLTNQRLTRQPQLPRQRRMSAGLRRAMIAGDAMRACWIVTGLLFTATAGFAQSPKSLPPAIAIWPKGAPGSEARASEAEVVNGSNVSNVHNPTLTPYVPDAGQSSGTAVIICPGGGHSKRCLGHEGYALAEWFRDHGIAAFVLKYRLARDKGSTPHR